MVDKIEQVIAYMGAQRLGAPSNHYRPNTQSGGQAQYRVNPISAHSSSSTNASRQSTTLRSQAQSQLRPTGEVSHVTLPPTSTVRHTAASERINVQTQLGTSSAYFHSRQAFRSAFNKH